MRGLNREQREQARLVSDLVDSLVLRRRQHAAHWEPGVPDRRELRELAAFAEALSEVAIAPPDGFARALFHRLPALAADADQAHSGRAGFFRSALAPIRVAVPSAALAMLVATVLVIVRLLVATPVASAGEILIRSDAAFARLVRPGEVLHRRWKVATVTTQPSGVTVRRGERMVHEWLAGGDVERVAGRWYSKDDRLLIAYTSVAPNGERRPYVYFSPGVYGEELGLLSIEPTRQEFREAVNRFPAAVQPALRVYLDRQYIYLPITGELRFNHAILEAPRRDFTGMPRLVLSLDPAGTWQGIGVYRVRVVDPVSIAFNWRSEGPPRVRLVRSEIVRYVARDSFLSVRTEQTDTFEDGRKTFTTKELVETRTVRAIDLSLDPFRLEVPDGTPLQRQSAFELLSGVANALGRLPQMASPPGPHVGRTPVDQ